LLLQVRKKQYLGFAPLAPIVIQQEHMKISPRTTANYLFSILFVVVVVVRVPIGAP